MKHVQIRNEYLKFFESKGHRIISSDSLVPAGDATLLFTSAGMTQFKNEFMGNVKDFTRAASCQKCMRTADLENVGKTAYHHSFFEMLGNFSFGDYFKKEAISWAWEFLTRNLKIESQNLWASVYEEDDEAYDIWRNIIKLPSERIIKLGQKDNFWPSEAKDKGPNGPCGPCSEIYYDFGKQAGCGNDKCSPACSCGRFVEVWNLVFTQFDRKDAGALEPLPNKNIDTGMGIERLCAVIQGVHNNFETDLFTPIIDAIKCELRVTGDGLRITNVHAIADHIRAVVFAISDGITPSNEERGYVIRNILRKALLHAIDTGAQEPVLYKIVYSVAKTMQQPYPELLDKHQDIARIIKIEEKRFFNTLQQGKKILENEIEDIKKNGKNIIPGQALFRLFDTHGLPLVLIKEIASRQGISVDEKGFESLMQAQREKSRKRSTLSGAVFIDSGIKEKTVFIGYDKGSSEAQVLRLMLPDGTDIDEADSSLEKLEIILDRSVFYPQQGGQEPDKGRLYSALMEAEVIYARKIQDAIILEARVLKGSIKKNQILETAIDKNRRLSIAKNHTATHLLQSALRVVLGEHVQQQGSMVDADRLRFDFTHFQAMTADEIEKTERLVCENIEKAAPVKIEEMGIEQAKRTGALAFFGEKYNQEVRVVKAGDKSLELCGGTHLENTAQVEKFRIAREGAVASGIRRIEAVTAGYASLWDKEKQRKIQEKELREQKRREEKLKEKNIIKKADAMVEDVLSDREMLGNTSLIIKCLDNQNMGALKRISDIIKTRIKDEYIIFLVSTQEQNASVFLLASKGLIEKGVNSSVLLSKVLKPFSGSGGGKPDMAQGGIKELKDKDSLIFSAKDIILKSLKDIQ